MKKIGVIGTGIMGAGIVYNFLKNGYEVFVWNRSLYRLKPLIKRGAKVTDSPKEATEKSDIIFEVTANDQSSKTVWTKKDGILAGADKNKILITCATLSFGWTQKLASICAKKGLTFFDMPMRGGRQGAENGVLILMVGGESGKLKRLEKDLKAISSKVIYFGKAGMGMRFKLILNMLQALHLLSLGETLKIAKNIGLDVEKVGGAFLERPGGAITKLGWEGYQHVPNPINFSAEWITKDLRYAKKLAKNLKTPLLDKALAKYKQVLKRNLGSKDWTIAIKDNG